MRAPGGTTHSLRAMDWTESTELVPLDASDAETARFTATVGEEWSSLQGAHGGIVAALAVEASQAVLAQQGVDPATRLRAATFGYVRGNRIGPVDIAVEVIRRGRALVTTHVTVGQDGQTTTVGRLHHSTPWEGMVYSDVDPPAPRPEGTVRIEIPGPAHINNVETHLHPDTMAFAGGPRAEWSAWSRPLHGGDLDAAWLVMFADYFPPAVFARVTEPVRAVTIEYSIQIHSTAGRWHLEPGEYLATRVHAFESRDGFAVEDGWIHLPDGTLLATMRQTRLAG